MNPAKLIEELSSDGIYIRVDGAYLEVRHKKPVSVEIVQYLKQHKQEIIQYLQPSNQSRYNQRYAYRFTLKNNKGGGTYITERPPDEAENELLNMFIDRELESVVLLN